MSEPSVVYVSNNEGDGDWAALYVNGKRFHEGHDVPVWVWLDAIKKLTRDYVAVEIEEVSTTNEEAEDGYPEFWRGDHG